MKATNRLRNGKHSKTRHAHRPVPRGGRKQPGAPFRAGARARRRAGARAEGFAAGC